MASSPEYTPPTYAPSTPEYTPSTPVYMPSVPVYSPSNPGMPGFYMPPSPAHISATPEYTPSGSFSPEYASATSEFYTPARSYTPNSREYTTATSDFYTPSVLGDTAMSEHAPSAAADFYNPSSQEFYQPMLTPEDYAPASSTWPPTPGYTPNSPEYTSATSDIYTPSVLLVPEDAATSEHTPSTAADFYNPSSPEFCQPMFTPEDFAPSKHNLHLQSSIPEYTPSIPDFDIPEYITSGPDFCPPYESYYPRPLEYIPLAPNLNSKLSLECTPTASSLDLKLSSSEYTPSAPSLDLELSSEYTPSAPNLDLKL